MATERSDDSEIGAILRRNIDGFLAALDMKPKDLYEALGMPASTYSSMFKSDNGPSMATIHKIAIELNCDPSELVNEA